MSAGRRARSKKNLRKMLPLTKLFIVSSLLISTVTTYAAVPPRTTCSVSVAPIDAKGKTTEMTVDVFTDHAALSGAYADFGLSARETIEVVSGRTRPGLVASPCLTP